MKHKKLFAILTLVCFMFTLMPVAVFATEGETVASTEEAQEALDVINSGTITLAPGDYGTLYIRQTTGSSISVDFTDWAGNGDYERFRALENVTIQGGAGVNVERIVVEAATYPSESGHSNAVNMERLNSFIVLHNVMVKDINFTATNGVAFDVNSKQVDIDGLTLDGCTTNGAVLIQNHNGTAEQYSGSGKTFIRQNKNIKVNRCTVNGGEFGINFVGANGLTITNNVFNGVNKQNIMLNKNDNTGIKLTGAITVDGNRFDGGSERAIRINGAEGTVTISNNTVTNYAGSDDDFIKVSAYSNIVNGENNIVQGKCNIVSDDTEKKEWKVVYKETHDYDKQVTDVTYKATDVTCKAKATYFYSCECGAVSDETFEYGDLATHTLTAVDKVDATCTATGTEAYYKCDVCDALFSDAEGKKEIAEPVTIAVKAHTLTAVAKVEPTYSATGMEAHDKCSVCEKLFVNGVEKTVEQLTIAKLVYSGGGGSYVPSTPSTSDKTETTTTVTPSGNTVTVEKETTSEGTVIETTTTTTASGETSTTVTATLDNGAAVTNNDAAVEVEVSKVEEKVVEQVEEAVKADETVTVVGDADNAISVSATNASTGAAQSNFVQPMSVSVPMDNAALRDVEDTSKLTLAKVVTNEDGTTELVYMGGSYDEETGTFNAKIDEDGEYIVVEKADLVKIELTIGETDVLHNDQEAKLDVAPTIDAAVGRTELPLRYLGEALGFGIDWNDNVVTITKGDVSFSLTIGQEIPGFGTPYVDSEAGRTMVSARYISEMLGANVIWDPAARQVIVVK